MHYYNTIFVNKCFNTIKSYSYVHFNILCKYCNSNLLYFYLGRYKSLQYSHRYIKGTYIYIV